MCDSPRFKPSTFDGLHIDAGDGKARLGEFHGQRQTYIAEPDDANPSCSALDLFFQCLIRLDRSLRHLHKLSLSHDWMM